MLSAPVRWCTREGTKVLEAGTDKVWNQRGRAGFGLSRPREPMALENTDPGPQIPASDLKEYPFPVLGSGDGSVSL